MIYLKKYCQYLFFACISFSCNNQKNELTYALELASDNRAELEQVLEHYADEPEKLAAARFLIENMPGHYSYIDTAKVGRVYDSLDSLIDAMADSDHKSLQDAVTTLCTDRRVAYFAIEQDVRLIKSDFLIKNIDRAFEQWRNIPWCRNLDFNQFCEYLLPYKTTETQALSDWWNDYDDIIADSLERLSSCSLFRVSAFQAAEAVNNALRRHFVRDPESYPIPPLYYRQQTRLRVPFGTCDDYCNAGLTAFRAAGIPVAIDYTPVWGYGNRGHIWAVVRTPNGKDKEFVPIHMSPSVVHKINETVSKVYRKTYARNEELVRLNASGEWVPETFRNVFQRDVTSLYAEPHDLTLKVDAPGKYVYLCTSSRAQWKPVAFAEIKDGKATFKDMGRGIVCLVVAYDRRGKMMPLTEPLKFDRDGSVTEIVADKDSLIDVRLYRKAPLLEYAWNMAVRTEHGEFEAADDPTFRHPVKVGMVNTPADRAGELKIDAGAHRYWRYVQKGDSAICCIGEVTLLTDGVCINASGRPIGNSPGGEGLHSVSRAFDGDVLTAVTFTKPDEAWVCLDFGKPVKIDMIRYSPRSDGNMIEPGDEYELTYWADGEWRSLGRKTATTVSLDWNAVPAGGVYVLLNRTKGDSVRIFLIDENGHQEWW